MYKSPVSPGGTGFKSSPRTSSCSPVQAAPIGIDSRGFSGHAGTVYQLLAMVVSVGPYRLVNVALGSRFIQYISAGVGNTSPHQSTRLSCGKSFTFTTSNFAMKLRAEG